jgi:hypothetical protein
LELFFCLLPWNKRSDLFLPNLMAERVSNVAPQFVQQEAEAADSLLYLTNAFLK